MNRIGERSNVNNVPGHQGTRGPGNNTVLTKLKRVMNKFFRSPQSQPPEYELTTKNLSTGFTQEVRPTKVLEKTMNKEPSWGDLITALAQKIRPLTDNNCLVYEGELAQDQVDQMGATWTLNAQTGEIGIILSYRVTDRETGEKFWTCELVTPVKTENSDKVSHVKIKKFKNELPLNEYSGRYLNTHPINENTLSFLTLQRHLDSPLKQLTLDYSY